jgi:hypothetical protein
VTPRDEAVEVIRKLKEELYLARSTVVELMPEKYQRILRSYYDYKSSRETSGWDDDAAESIIELAELLPQEIAGPYGSRAMCPLCGEGTTHPYETGFSVPEGLRRHLTGYGNTQRCRVMAAALGMARQHWHREFDAIDREERQREEAKLAEKRRTEMLYRTGPFGEPELIDSGWMFGPPRTAEGLAWAEERARSLGFSVELVGNVKSIVRDHGSCIVFADIRSTGSIEFKAFQLPLKRKRVGPFYERFTLPDGWKKNIREKYEDRARQLFRKN